MFFLLALFLGGGTIYLIAEGVLSSDLVLVSVLSASIAGIIMTAVMDGKAGLKLMFNRLSIWRVECRYWLFATLFLVPVILLGLLLNPIFSGDPISINRLKPAFNILPMFVVFFFVAGVGQELGWTGFLIPRLQARYSALVSTLIRAVLIAVWHLPVFIYAWLRPTIITSLPYPGWIAQKGFLVAFLAASLLFIFPWSLFFTWIFNNTRGSLLLVAVLHASEMWVAFWMLSTGIDETTLDNYWGYGAIMVLAALIMIIATGPKNLSRSYPRIIHTRNG